MGEVTPSRTNMDRQPSGSPLAPHSFRLTLEGTSAALTRALVRRATAHLPTEVGYRAVLLVDEVVTNAMVHSAGDFTLELLVDSDRLRVSVRDTSSKMPVLRQAPVDRERGRGLAIVSAWASSWGADACAEGKRVWFELPLAAG